MKRSGRLISVTLIVVMLFVLCGAQGVFATGLIFNSGFEPGSTGTVTTDPGAIRDITGIDNSLPANNNWIDSLENYSTIGSHQIQYESGDNSHQRYARIIDDPTNTLFEDSFDDAYAIGDIAHINPVAGDRRNWKEQVIGSNATIKVVQDPLESDYAMEFRNITGTSTGPRLEEVTDASETKRISVAYKVMTNTKSTRLEVALPLVSSIPSVTPISVNNITATANGQTATVASDAWVNVKVDMDFYYNIYTVSVNDTVLTANASLFGTSQSAADLSQVRIRFVSTLSTLNATTLLDDVKISKTPVRFQDNFDREYGINDVPHTASAGLSRVNWSAYLATDATVSVQADPDNAANQAMRLVNNRTTTNYPRLDKSIDASATQKLTVNYKVKNLTRNTYIDIALPSVSGAPSKTVFRVNGSTATANAQTAVIDPNAWTTVSLLFDFYNNAYDVYVNDTLLTSNETLFTTAQTAFGNVRVRFNSALPQNAYYYLDDVEISNSANMVLKFYGGKVINDSKLRVQSTISGNDGLTQVYAKYRMYLNEGFEPFKTALNGVTSYWFTLGEYMDGSCWAWTGPDPNYTSRVTLGIAKPTGASDPLKFNVHFQHAKLDEAEFGANIWAYDSSVDVPIGQWVTCEVYLKQGIGTDPLNGGGQYQFYITGADGVRQTVFDIADSTYNVNAGLNGFEHTYFMKMYGNKMLFNNVNTANSDLQIYWDDFELRDVKPW